MHHEKRGPSHILRNEITVGHSIQAVGSGPDKTQVLSKSSAINSKSMACESTTAQGHGVDTWDLVQKALAVEQEKSVANY